MIDTVTIVGRVATDPVQGQTGGGIPVTNFRMASTHRRFDTATQTWIDAGTNWFSVAAFRQLGEHAKTSLRTGDGIIVTGRLKIRTWENNGKQGTSVDIDADVIGHDLRWGTTAYRPRRRTDATETAEDTAAETDIDHTADDEADARDATEDEDLPDLDLSWAVPSADEERAHTAGA
ncbi:MULTISPECIES: single-stranded DNA-binding protein [unclassified Microbacterium]|uniref:single-stranded DNA-binding protein n=1 Tax=unclassified Microbacterium TaxID=2609290 RepID=UPI000EA9B366|nr:MULTISPECIES: single-stranded DNA-binding protein [unclassified Microbacterium]MBT2485836.1 single-stranded DNA-binding protein [Microbacterium sp. ISL-108]RKN68598.1 single-stranded DNA-binding protein [Microbacterium sp. CGR2]